MRWNPPSSGHGTIEPREVSALKPFEVVVDTDLEDLIPAFLGNRAAEADTIAEAISRADFARLKGLGHNLKGVAGSYGFEGLARLGVQLEEHAEAQRLAEAETVLARIREYLQAVEVRFEDS